jgi:hypothetical protein
MYILIYFVDLNVLFLIKIGFVYRQIKQLDQGYLTDANKYFLVIIS